MDLQLPQVRRDKLAERVPVTRPGARERGLGAHGSFSRWAKAAAIPRLTPRLEPTTTAGLSDRSLIIVLVLRVHRFTGCR